MIWGTGRCSNIAPTIRNTRCGILIYLDKHNTVVSPSPVTANVLGRIFTRGDTGRPRYSGTALHENGRNPNHGAQHVARQGRYSAWPVVRKRFSGASHARFYNSRGPQSITITMRFIDSTWMHSDNGDFCRLCMFEPETDRTRRFISAFAVTPDGDVPKMLLELLKIDVSEQLESTRLGDRRHWHRLFFSSGGPRRRDPESHLWSLLSCSGDRCKFYEKSADHLETHRVFYE